MPLVNVTYNPNAILEQHLKPLGNCLRLKVAWALTCEDEGGSLTPDDIEVRFHAVGPHDINASDLMIEVFANDFPSRRRNIQDRAEAIAEAVREFHNRGGGLRSSDFGGKNFVWVLLAPAGFVFL